MDREKISFQLWLWSKCRQFRVVITFATNTVPLLPYLPKRLICLSYTLQTSGYLCKSWLYLGIQSTKTTEYYIPDNILSILVSYTRNSRQKLNTLLQLDSFNKVVLWLNFLLLHSEEIIIHKHYKLKQRFILCFNERGKANGYITQASQLTKNIFMK